MTDHLEPVHLHARLIQSDARLALRDGYLVFHRIHAFQVWQKEPAPESFFHDHAVSFYVQFGFGSYRFRLPEHIHIDRQLFQLRLRDRRKARITGRGGYRIADDLVRERITRRRDRTDASAQVSVLMNGSYRVESNRESGYGRFDIAFFPLKAGTPGVILELKSAKSEEELEQQAGAALRQIEEKEYIAELSRQGVKETWKYGISFYGKRVCMERG